MISRLFSSVTQPVSWYRALRDTSLVVPVAIRAASIWIFSISCFSNCVQLSHTISPYSSKGLIKVVNIISRELLSNLNFEFSHNINPVPCFFSYVVNILVPSAVVG